MDRFAHLLEGAAAADIGDGGVDIGVGRLRIVFQQRGDGHDHAALAIAALRHIVIHPGFLDFVRRVARGQSFDGNDLLPTASLTCMAQERVATPSIWTVQAPHCAMPHPYFVPVSPTFSRMAHSRGVSGSTSTLTSFPLMLRRIMDFSPDMPAAPPQAPSCEINEFRFSLFQIKSVGRSALNSGDRPIFRLRHPAAAKLQCWNVLKADCGITGA